MTRSSKREPLAGSDPVHRSSARPTGETAADAIVQVVLVLRCARQVQDPGAPLPTGAMRSEADFESFQAPLDADVDLVRTFAADHGLDVVAVSRPRHDVVLEGPARLVSEAFSLMLEEYEHPGGRYRSHAGPVHLRRDLHRAVLGVLGLDEGPTGASGVAHARGNARTRYTPHEIARYYDFPEGVDATGQRIALLEFGGGYHRSDVETFFEEIAGVPTPPIRDVLVGGATNDPLDIETIARYVHDRDDDPDMTFDSFVAKYGRILDRADGTLEATMDLEIAGAVARGASIDMVFAPPNPRGYYEAVYAGLGLGGEASRAADVMSMSWGGPESSWGSHVRSIGAALEAARIKGVNVCVATGDFGSGSVVRNASEAAVYFPASSPHVLACGGTKFVVSADGGIEGEESWKGEALGIPMGTGGGVSGVFSRPDYQNGVAVPAHRDLNGPAWLSAEVKDAESFVGRGVPDVSALADASRGYLMFAGGKRVTGSGTSAGTPLWAALLALLAAIRGEPLGWLNAILYRPELTAGFRDIVLGDNKLSDGIAYFTAHRGWDPCTGLGTPLGTALRELLDGRSPAPRKPEGGGEPPPSGAT